MSERRPAAGSDERPEGPASPLLIDTRRYRWMIGIFGMLLLVAFSIYLTARGSQTAGVPAGKRLPLWSLRIAAASWAQRLIGDHWLSRTALAARVRALLAAGQR